MRRSRIWVAATAIALALVVAIGATGCGGSDAADDADAGNHGTHSATHTAAFEGGVITPQVAAPPLRLNDIHGAAFDLRQLRGDPVLVTFVYASCPDVCPLLMQEIRRARELSGPLGQRLKVVAVSVDPEGDTPAVVSAFLKRQRLQGFVTYLIGTRAQLEPVWSAWQVATDVPRDNPELVEHTALIYGVTAGGELATAYPVNFEAAAIARDLSLLARADPPSS